MLRLFVISFAALLLLSSGCSPQQTPDRVIQLTPGSVLQAQFGPCDCIAVATLEQIAVYNLAGELHTLLNLPDASPYWQLAWLKPDELVITNDKELFHWQPSTQRLIGPWQTPHSIRRVVAAAGRVALELSDRSLMTFVFSADGLESQQRFPLNSSLATLHAFSGEGIVAATQSGSLVFWSWPAQGSFNAEPTWQVAQLQPTVSRAVSLHGEQLWLVAQAEGDHFARGGGQQLLHIDIADGKLQHSTPLPIEGQAASLLVSQDSGWVGSSENCFYSIQPSAPNPVRLGPFCAPDAQRFGRRSGQVVALKVVDDQLLAITTSGYLQIWPKSVIVSSPYGSKH